mmetsp:Transcript_44535/g.73899  ORF Transcript_44535/g.73899 Transcript_44535/m.73899 type:complete len:280 (+) Transcript_44535:1043-1882(+)
MTTSCCSESPCSRGPTSPDMIGTSSSGALRVASSLICGESTSMASTVENTSQFVDSIAASFGACCRVGGVSSCGSAFTFTWLPAGSGARSAVRAMLSWCSAFTPSASGARCSIAFSLLCAAGAPSGRTLWLHAPRGAGLAAFTILELPRSTIDGTPSSAAVCTVGCARPLDADVAGTASLREEGRALVVAAALAATAVVSRVAAGGNVDPCILTSVIGGVTAEVLLETFLLFELERSLLASRLTLCGVTLSSALRSRFPNVRFASSAAEPFVACPTVAS